MKGKIFQKRVNYNQTGSKLIESYTLKSTNKKKFKFIDKALFDEDGKILKFYVPKVEKNVSHSLILNPNIDQNNSIEVESITIANIINFYKIKNLEILKLDIEGYECEVIQQIIIKDKIFPKQICIEFDELGYLNFTIYKKIIETHSILIKNNYTIYKNLSTNNYTYLRSDLIN